MSKLDAAALDELERMEKEATPERWEAHGNWMNANATVIAARFDEGLGIVFAIADNTAGTKNDAALIVALRNHARALIAAARALEKIKTAIDKGAAEGPFFCDRPDCVLGEVKLILAALSRAANRDGASK